MNSSCCVNEKNKRLTEMALKAFLGLEFSYVMPTKVVTPLYWCEFL